VRTQRDFDISSVGSFLPLAAQSTKVSFRIPRHSLHHARTYTLLTFSVVEVRVANGRFRLLKTTNSTVLLVRESPRLSAHPS
jgi:hypothetical protein